MVIKEFMNQLMGGFISTAIIFAVALITNSLACTIGGYPEPPMGYVFHLSVASAIISFILYIQENVKSFFKKK